MCFLLFVYVVRLYILLVYSIVWLYFILYYCCGCFVQFAIWLFFVADPNCQMVIAISYKYCSRERCAHRMRTTQAVLPGASLPANFIHHMQKFNIFVIYKPFSQQQSIVSQQVRLISAFLGVLCKNKQYHILYNTSVSIITKL